MSFFPVPDFQAVKWMFPQVDDFCFSLKNKRKTHSGFFANFFQIVSRYTGPLL